MRHGLTIWKLREQRRTAQRRTEQRVRERKTKREGCKIDKMMELAEGKSAPKMVLVGNPLLPQLDPETADEMARQFRRRWPQWYDPDRYPKK